MLSFTAKIPFCLCRENEKGYETIHVSWLLRNRGEKLSFFTGHTQENATCNEDAFQLIFKMCKNKMEYRSQISLWQMISNMKNYEMAVELQISTV